MASYDQGIVAVLSADSSLGCVSAYLFGSAASGREHRESDVDVAVLLSYARHSTPADRFDVRLRLATRLGAALGRDVDLVILNDAPPQFARRILTEGRCVAMYDDAGDRAFRRTALSRAADIEPFLRRAREVKLSALGR